VIEPAVKGERTQTRSSFSRADWLAANSSAQQLLLSLQADRRTAEPACGVESGAAIATPEKRRCEATQQVDAEPIISERD
jgi:hypothetical protein